MSRTDDRHRAKEKVGKAHGDNPIMSSLKGEKRNIMNCQVATALSLIAGALSTTHV